MKECKLLFRRVILGRWGGGIGRDKWQAHRRDELTKILTVPSCVPVRPR